jgi:hypothetical protein
VVFVGLHFVAFVRLMPSFNESDVKRE